MTTAEFFRHYFRSALGLASLAACLGIAFLAQTVFGFAGAIIALVVSMAGSVVLIALFGGKVVVAERERVLAEGAAEAISLVRDNAETLARIRLPNADISGERDFAALAAKRYADACAKTGSRDPRADDAIAECLELLDIYKKELDGSSLEKRFDRPDDDPFPESLKRVKSALREKGTAIDSARLAIEGGLTEADKLSIREELK